MPHVVSVHAGRRVCVVTSSSSSWPASIIAGASRTCADRVALDRASAHPCRRAGPLQSGERYSICGKFAITGQGQWRALEAQEQTNTAPQFSGVDAQGRNVACSGAAERSAAPVKSQVSC